MWHTPYAMTNTMGLVSPLVVEKQLEDARKRRDNSVFGERSLLCFSGTGFDLPIAVGILAALGIVNPEKAAKMIFCGELALDGRVKPVAGYLPISIQARTGATAT